MKVNELMIGDWVYNTHNRQNEQVAEIGSGLVMLAYNDLYEYDEIEPIPLTPEILEKNGFYYDETRKSYLMGVIFQIKPEKLGLFSFEICGCPYPLNTVHELQHALRLCRIEKEIIL